MYLQLWPYMKTRIPVLMAFNSALRQSFGGMSTWKDFKMRARSGSSMLLSLLTQASLKVSTIKSKSLKEMPMGLEIYLISSLISNTFQFPKSFLEPTENYEEPKWFIINICGQLKNKQKKLSHKLPRGMTRVCHLRRKKGAKGGSFFAVKQGKTFNNK